jgi:hypothetical protein
MLGVRYVRHVRALRRRRRIEAHVVGCSPASAAAVSALGCVQIQPSASRGDLRPPPVAHWQALWCGRDKLLVKIDTSWNENDIDELDRKGFVITAVVPSSNFSRTAPGNEFFGHAD